MSELDIEIARHRAIGHGEDVVDSRSNSAVAGSGGDTASDLVAQAHTLLRRGRSDTLIIYTGAPWYLTAHRVTEVSTGLPVGPGATRRRWRTAEEHRCWVLGNLGHQDSTGAGVVQDGFVLLLDDGRAVNIFSTESHAIGKTIRLHVPGDRRDVAAALRTYEHPLGPFVVLHDGDGGTQTLVSLLARCVLAYE